ncbi:hypothetical protein [Draconibacterium mangrovi]|uniref:hypothetical protein n=1 Tax=Draconibacterium mangrovi TaxID=2697469 RepID=UPI0013D4FC73|nr:hypothetical protein [Draconibacterium mangrovi]
MNDSTKYDKIITFLLDYWIIAIIVIIALLIAFIPSFWDGILQISKFTKTILSKKTNDFVIKHDGETITCEYKTKSTYFDIVKINAITHSIGLNAEYSWIKRHYPRYNITSQGLSKIDINKNQSLYFDNLTIINDKGDEKIIYFDISDFYNKSGHTSVDLDRFAREKIRELYKKDKNSS